MPKVAFAAVAGLVVGILFITSNVVALHAPKPHEVPVAAAGVPVDVLQAQLDKATPDGYSVHPAAGAAQAARLIRERLDYGALSLENGRPTVLVASANGMNASMAVRQALTQAAHGLGLAGAPATRDVVPLQPGDPRGLSLQMIVLGTIIGGFMCGVFAAQLALDEPLWVRTLAFVLFGAAFGGLAALALGPLTGVLKHETRWIWLWLGVAPVAMALSASALARLAGQAGIGLAILVFLVVGNPSAGASTPSPFLPGFYRVAGPFLPPHATASGLLGTTYFHAGVLRPAVVLGAWAVVSLVLLFALDRRHGRRRPLAYAAASAAAEPVPERQAA